MNIHERISPRFDKDGKPLKVYAKAEEKARKAKIKSAEKALKAIDKLKKK